MTYCLLLLMLAADPAAADFAVDVGHPLGLLAPGSEAALVVPAGEARSLEVTIQDQPPAIGAPRPDWQRTWTVDVPAAETETRVPIPAGKVGPLGIRYLRVRTVGDPGDGWTTSLAHAEPIGITPGVQSTPLLLGNDGLDSRPRANADDAERVMAANAAMGVELIRTNTAWRFIQPDENGPIDFSGLDRSVDLAERHGQRILLILCYGGAEWTKSDATRARIAADGRESRQWTYPPRVEPWRALVHAIASRYRGRGVQYEVWNEPDLGFFRGTADEYARLLRAATEEIRVADPDAVVVSGGIGTTEHGEHNPAVLDAVLAMPGAFDRFGYHCHGTFGQFRKQVEAVEPRRRQLGVPWMWTESALGRGTANEGELADELVKRIAYAGSFDAAGYCWFTTWGNRHSVASSAYQYRMFNIDWTPRPSVPAMTTLVRLLRGRTFDRTLDLGDGRYGFVYSGDGPLEDDSLGGGPARVAVVWTEDDRLSEGLFLVRGGDGAEQIDRFGNRRPLRGDASGWAAVRVGRHPSYLRLPGTTSGTKSIEMQAFVQSPATDAAVLYAGQSTTSRLRVTNPTDRPLRVRIDWSGRGLRCDPAGWERTLPPGGLGLASTQVVATSRARSRTGGGLVGLTATVQAGSGDAVAIEQRMRWGLVLTDRLPDPQIVLDQSEDDVPLYPNDPNNDFRRWTGPEDRSLRASLAATGRELQLRIDARDDIREPPSGKAGLFLFDAVRLKLAMPDQPKVWTIDVALNAEGESAIVDGLQGTPVDRRTAPPMRLRINQRDGGLEYLIALPWARLGTTAAAVTNDGFALGLELHDADGQGRDGYLTLTPGSDGKTAAELVPIQVRP